MRTTRFSDRAFTWAALALALLVLLVTAAILLGVIDGSQPAIREFGAGFVTGRTWDPVKEVYGALPFIYGTLVTSFSALLLAGLAGVGAAVFLAEIAPARVRTPLSFMVELLAGIPSIVYGIWGLFVLAPFLRQDVVPALKATLGWTGLFQGAFYGPSVLTASVVLALMVLPIVTAVSRDVLLAVPTSQREAMLGLGATRWEVIRGAVLPYARSGILGALILGLARAVGETMAVTMVIGNRSEISASLLKPGNTMASVIANEFAEATTALHQSALIEIGLLLFVITLVTNMVARLLVWRVAGKAQPRRAWGMGDLPNVSRVRPSSHYWQMSERRVRRRHMVDRIMMGLITIAVLAAVAPLLLVLGWVALKGIGALNLDLFTRLPGPPDDPHTGFANGIVGTLVLVGIATLISVPVGIGAGIYLSEFGGSKTNTVIRFATDVLAGVPSITIGIFVYAWVVRPMGSFSAWAGGISLALIMVPLIVRSTEEMLRLVPQTIREAALALGAPVWRTVLSYALPAALPGVITGVLLAMARAAGETAPLLFTALGNNQWSTSLNQPVAALTLQVYFGAQSAYEVQKQQAWAGALVLVALVLITGVLSRVAVRRASGSKR